MPALRVTISSVKAVQIYPSSDACVHTHPEMLRICTEGEIIS